jgi:hypothetical protein
MSFFSRLRQAFEGAKPSRSAATTSHHITLRPGQILGSRFEIVRQLGAGQHSTVWLATTYVRVLDAFDRNEYILKEIMALRH